MNKSAMIIINPSAGKKDAASYEESINEELKGSYNNIIIKYTKGQGDATSFAREACKEKFDILVSVGGDGTVNETINGLASFENPPLLGIVPMGTVNNLAKALNIPNNAKEAIDLLSKGKGRKIDVGLANDRYFTNTLGVGKLAEAVNNVEIEEKTKLGPLAYVKALGGEVLKNEEFQVKLEMDKENWEGDAGLIGVGLLDTMAGFKSILSEAEIGDGKLHVLVLQGVGLAKLLDVTSSIVLESIIDSKYIKYFQTSEIKISTLDCSSYESNVDGDKGPDLPLHIQVFPRHLEVISKRV